MGFLLRGFGVSLQVAGSLGGLSSGPTRPPLGRLLGSKTLVICTKGKVSRPCFWVYFGYFGGPGRYGKPCLRRSLNAEPGTESFCSAILCCLSSFGVASWPSWQKPQAAPLRQAPLAILVSDPPYTLLGGVLTKET